MEIVKHAVEIGAIDFSPYGIVCDMRADAPASHLVERSAGDGWRDANTTQPLIDTPGALGYTVGSGTPFVARDMEMHLHTQEALFPTDRPIVFLVARACEGAPRAEDVIPVIVRPGQVAVLHRRTWHSAAHGIGEEAYYHYLALVYKNEPTTWSDIQGGPVRVLG